MKKTIDFLKKAIDFVAFVFDRRAGVDAGICDYSGQGRDRFGN